MDTLIASLESEWIRFVAWLPKLPQALVVLGVFAILARIAARAAHLFLMQTELAATHQKFFVRLTLWVISGIGLVFAMGIAGFGFVAAGLLASGGLTAVVLGFAFREIGENFLAGFFLAFSCPFRLGDLIQSGDLEGVVRGIELRSTHIRTADGRDIFIPNAHIFNRPLVNYTLDGLRRPSVIVGIDYADDAAGACALIEAEVQKLPGVLEKPRVQVQISGLLPTYVELKVLFWVNTFEAGIDVPQLRSNVANCCRQQLREAGFTLSNDATTNLALFKGSPLALEVAQAGRP